ncbi:CLUMA_CG005342, isoform A [Clunio marinus]|uniref:CLUMA_CG005342, isoform A n=1 Tax=Clunio marinus TaxID=568069 RepID=A0A1J1HUE7_9DIPT|nr:CLUMA_CG005342, isoform A [Clunio marinus]
MADNWDTSISPFFFIPFIGFVVFSICVCGCVCFAIMMRKRKQALYSNPIVVTSHTHEPIGNQQPTHQVQIQTSRNDTFEMNLQTDNHMPSYQQNVSMPMPMPMPMPQTNYHNESQITVPTAPSAPTAPYPTTSYISPYPVNQPSVTMGHNVESQENSNPPSYNQVVGWETKKI